MFPRKSSPSKHRGINSGRHDERVPDFSNLCRGAKAVSISKDLEGSGVPQSQVSALLPVTEYEVTATSLEWWSDKFRASLPEIQGFVWLFVGIALLQGSLIIVRHASADLPTLEIVFFRVLFGVCAMVPWLMKNSFKALKTERIGLHSLRSGCELIRIAAVFGAVAIIPVADAQAIIFARPFFVTLLAILFLKEVVGLRLWISMGVGLVGVLIILRPGFEELSLGYGLAILTAIFGAFSIVLLRILSRTEAADLNATYTTLLMVPPMFVAVLFVWHTPTWIELAWLVGIGFLSQYSQRCFTRAYKLVETSVLQPLEFTRLPMAALLGVLIFGEFPDIWVWLGGFIIFVAAIYVIRLKAKQPKQPAIA